MQARPVEILLRRLWRLPSWDIRFAFCRRSDEGSGHVKSCELLSRPGCRCRCVCCCHEVVEVLLPRMLVMRMLYIRQHRRSFRPTLPCSRIPHSTGVSFGLRQSLPNRYAAVCNCPARQGRPLRMDADADPPHAYQLYDKLVEDWPI